MTEETLPIALPAAALAGDVLAEQPAEARLNPKANPGIKLAQLKGLGLVLLTLVVGGILLLGFRWVGGDELLGRWKASSAVALVPIQAVVAVSPFPSEVLAMSTNSAHGFWLGAAVNWAAWVLAAFLQYLLARRVADDFDFESVRARLPRRLAQLPVSHPAFLIFVRFLPLGPDVVNTTAGAFRVPMRRHLTCAVISVLPQALVFSALANGITLLGS